MLFLDIDLDFFLSKNAYFSGTAGIRLGRIYKPWSVANVKYFLENRCGLSIDVPVKGRIIDTHDGIINFWHTLIDSGELTVPFGVTHVDAHPDLLIGGGIHLTSDLLRINSGLINATLKNKHIHSGNYLTFAIAYGWVGSLLWVFLRRNYIGPLGWDGDARSISVQINERRPPLQDSSEVETERVIPFMALPWQSFVTKKRFNYIVLSRSPDFTPPESDRLVSVIEMYMKII